MRLRFRRGEVEQPPGLRLAQDFGQRPVPARTVQRPGRVVAANAFGVEELEELPENGQLARLRGRGESPRRDVGQIGPDIVGPGLPEIPHRLRRVLQVAAIGLQRIGRCAAFGAHHFEKGLDACGRVHGDVSGRDPTPSIGTGTTISRVRGSTSIASANMTP